MPKLQRRPPAPQPHSGGIGPARGRGRGWAKVPLGIERAPKVAKEVLRHRLRGTTQPWLKSSCNEIHQAAMKKEQSEVCSFVEKLPFLLISLRKPALRGTTLAPHPKTDEPPAPSPDS